MRIIFALSNNATWKIVHQFIHTHTFKKQYTLCEANLYFQCKNFFFGNENSDSGWKKYEVVTTKASMKAKLHVHRIFIHGPHWHKRERRFFWISLMHTNSRRRTVRFS